MNPSHQQGISLVGVLVALFFLMVGIVAISQMAAQNKHFISQNRNQLVATSLASEGVELVQAYRDTNWLQFTDDWTHGLCATTGEFAIDQDIIKLRAEGDMFPQTDFQIYRNKITGYFSHANSDTSNDIPTQFERKITINCDYQDGDSQADPPILPHIIVNSAVSWESPSEGSKEVSIKSILYDWRN
jgi:hypothetical protein